MALEGRDTRMKKKGTEATRATANSISSMRPGSLKAFGGSSADEFNIELMQSVARSLWHGDEITDPKANTAKKMGACAAVAGIRPTSETEGMLAAQMVALHSAAMECFRRAMIPSQTTYGIEMNLNYANKLSRTYALHMEALDKHRGKGQQKVTVEHVHVHQGGQAIVGTVQTGAGVEQKSGEQAHAETIAHSPEPAMRSPFETDAEAVPERRDEER